MPAVDTEHPSNTRVLDFLLGGKNNWLIDRQFASRLRGVLPQIDEQVAEEQAFRIRAVRTALADGIVQFIEVCAVVPTHDPLHTLIAYTPTSRVVYVADEPILSAHANFAIEQASKEELQRHRARVIDGSFLDPPSILDADSIRDQLDLTRPICLMLTGVLPYFGTNQNPAAAIRQFRERLAPRSLIVVSHATTDGLNPANAHDRALATGMRQVAAQFRRDTATPMTLRARATLRRYMTGLDVLTPGVTYTTLWRNPDRDRSIPPQHSLCFAAVARVPQKPDEVSEESMKAATAKTRSRVRGERLATFAARYDVPWQQMRETLMRTAAARRSGASTIDETLLGIFQEFVNELRESYENGESQISLSAAWDLRQASVHELLKQQEGLTLRPRLPIVRAAPSGLVEAYCERGMSIAEAAKRFDLSYGKARRMLLAADVTLRARGGTR